MSSAISTYSRVSSLTFLVVEDHPVYLHGLGSILQELHPSLNIEFVISADAAISYLEKQPLIDLLVVDLRVPGGGGLAVIEHVRNHKLFIPSIILSASEDPVDVSRAMRSGASGFISKASSSAEILEGIQSVMQGNTTLPRFFDVNALIYDAEKPVLTARQEQVLKLVCEGLPNKRICQELQLSEHTVKSHLKALFSILNVHNRTECMRVALEWDLI